jgi:hypothetical protein
MRAKLAIIDEYGVLDPDAKITEANLPSWLSETTLNATFAKKGEVTSSVTGVATPVASLLLAPAPAVPTAYAGDDFTGATGTIAGRISNKGQFGTWAVPSGTFTATAGGVTVATPATNGQIAVLPITLVGTAYSVSAALKTATSSATVKSVPGLVFRYQDASNYWYVGLTATPDGSDINKEGYVNLFRVLSGVTKRMAAVQQLPAGLTITDATANVVRVDLEGADIRIHVDGYELGTFPEYDILPASPKVGFRHVAVGAPSTSATFANLSVTEYAGPRYNWPKVETPKPVVNFAPFTYIGDDFTGAAGELNGRAANIGTANVWSSTAGQYVLNGSGGLTPNVGTDGVLAILPDTAAPATTPRTYIFTAAAAGTSDTVKSMPGLVFRYADASNYWYCYMDPSSGGTVTLRKKVAGADSLVRGINSLGFAFGQEVTFQVSDTGSVITVTVPGAASQSVTDSALNTNGGIGVRQGSGGSPTTRMTVSELRVQQNPAPVSGSSNPATQIIPLGAPGSWEADDVNNPNVVWDPENKRWVCYYSGYYTGGPQKMGLAYADTLVGPWVKDPLNGNINIPGPDGQNGGLAYKDGVWYHLSWGSEVRVYTSTDLHTWTKGALVVQDGDDPFLRVTENGDLETWYGNGHPTAQFFRTTSTDNGLTWSTPELMVAGPPGWSRMIGGNGEPTVYVPPGREGSQYLVFCDEIDYTVSNPSTRRMMCALTLDGGETWHWRRLMGGSGVDGTWDKDSKFDTCPVYGEGAFFLFHGGAPLPGIGLDAKISIGYASAQWSPYNNLATKPV